MDSELELHESVQELHALATVPDLYSLAVDLNLLSILLGCLAHENADISCAVLDVLQELTDVDTINEAEESTGLLIDNLIDLQAIGLLTQNLDRLDESNKDEADGVHNTLAIFENLFEIRPELCSTAGQNVSKRQITYLSYYHSYCEIENVAWFLTVAVANCNMQPVGERMPPSPPHLVDVSRNITEILDRGLWLD